MIRRVVYDTMLFVQWAASANTYKATIQALYTRAVTLVLSREAVQEIRDVLSRVELQVRLGLTPDRVDKIIEETVQLAEWIDDVPNVFTWPHHPDDDHNFNLAIAANAHRIVTWETRILGIEKNFPLDAARLQALAPQLRIVSPKQLSDELRDEL